MSTSFPILRDQTDCFGNSLQSVSTLVSGDCAGRTAGIIGFLFQRNTRNAGGDYERDRLSNLFRTLLGLFPSSQVSRAGNCGRLAALHPCALPSALYHPKDRRGCTTNPTAPRQSFLPRATMARVIEFFRACRPVHFGALKSPQKPLSGLFERLVFQVLSCSLRSHDENSSEGNLSWVTRAMSRVTKCL